jgi:predicted ATPase/class 3 adenylate cyclase
LSFLPNYQIEELIHQSRRSLVYRGFGGPAKEPVVIKVHREDHPSDRELARFRLGYTIGRRMTSSKVIRHLALEPFENNLAIVTEDYGAVSLERQIGPKGMPVPLVLQVALDLSEALAEVHQQNVIHKDITPSNVVRNAKTGVVKLIDFGISSLLTRENPQAASPGHLEGTLPYMSPEQTGRMNRSVDYRSDFYGLGATLYRLLSGRVPFPGNDPLEIIHCHLARQATPLHELNPAVPEALSGIVMKLLAKRAEDRYQSVFSLREDLKRCRSQLQETGTVVPFPLGAQDVSRFFQIPQTLYGREDEVRQLLGAFEEVAQGGREILLVAGYSGIGKTALVREVQRPIAARRGYFCMGKFDQFRRDLPYLALTKAMQDLVRQVLTEDADQIEQARERLLKAVESNGQVLCDVIPELKHLLGKQPAVPALGPTEAQNRFNRVFRSFINVFARAEHPLTVFLDDLQWADLPSLNLMQVLITDPICAHLFLVGAYRDNEVAAHHPLLETIRRIREKGQTVRQLTLTPLALADVAALTGDALHRSVDEVLSLARVVHCKTGGNPFFIGEFLKSVYEDGHINFLPDEGRWNWSLSEIQKAQTTDNVVDLVAAKLKTLPSETLELVQLAACIGSQFDLATLALAHGCSKAVAVSALSAALVDGLILPGDASYKYMESLVSASDDYNTSYHFLHDRVQQAAWSLIAPEAREELHLHIGWLLLKSTNASDLDERVLDIVNHLDIGMHRIEDPVERRRLAELNLKAGQKARASMAAEPARNYLRAGLELLVDDCWDRDYQLCLALHSATADAEFLCQGFDAMEEVAATVLTHARSQLDMVPVQDVRMRALIAQNRHQEALDLALDQLARLGVKLPREAGQSRILLSVLKTLWVIGRRSPMTLGDLPDMTDPRMLAAAQILMNAVSSAFFLQSGLFPVMLCKLVELSVRHGNTAWSIQGYSGFAIILCSVVGRVQRAHEMMQLAWAIMERFDARPQAAKLHLVAYDFIDHWRGPVRELPPRLMEGWQVGLEHGDVEYAVYCGLSVLYLSILGGRQLSMLDERYDPLVRSMLASGQVHSLPLVTCWRQLSACLQDHDFAQTRLVGEFYDADLRVPQLLGQRNFTAIVHGRTAESVLAYLLRDYRRVWDINEEAESFLKSVLGLYLVPTQSFYQALACCALARETGSSLKKASRNLERLRKWSRDAPMNHAHKAHLVEAELLRARGRIEEAVKSYRAAIEGARENGFIHEEAMAQELLGETYADQGVDDLAGFYLAQARHLYQRWGAAAKVAQMERHYSVILPQRVRTAVDSTVETGTWLSISTSDEQQIDVLLDLDSVTRAARTLSGEIELDRVVTHLMELAIVNAGAERGALLLNRDGELFVEAMGSVGDKPAAREAVPLSQDSPLPLAIIEYTRRTRESVLLRDATADDLFGQDPYVVQHKPHSVLCAPISHQGQISGIVYLENNLAPGAFTPERLQVLEILCAQAAISIENSRHFERERRQAEAFARFMPAAFLQQLNRESVIDVALGDAVQREITIMFSDIRDFTTMSEAMSVTDNFSFLNAYLSHLLPIIVRYDGIVDKFIGDAIMALFPGSPDDAVRAGCEMQEALRRYNGERILKGYAPIEMGIGIHVGTVMLGTVGSPERMDTTVIGDAVNLASRVEGLTKICGTRLLISSDVRDRLQDATAYHLRLFGRVRVKGRSRMATILEVLEAEPEPQRSLRMRTMDSFNEATRSFLDQDFRRALAHYRACVDEHDEDRIVQMYVDRCEELLTRSLPGDWSAVEAMAVDSTRPARLPD